MNTDKMQQIANLAVAMIEFEDLADACTVPSGEGLGQPGGPSYRQRSNEYKTQLREAVRTRNLP